MRSVVRKEHINGDAVARHRRGPAEVVRVVAPTQGVDTAATAAVCELMPSGGQVRECPREPEWRAPVFGNVPRASQPTGRYVNPEKRLAEPERHPGPLLARESRAARLR
jgi:hypothetical protein